MKNRRVPGPIVLLIFALLAAAMLLASYFVGRSLTRPGPDDEPAPPPPELPLEDMEPTVRAQFEAQLDLVESARDDPQGSQAAAEGSLGMLCHAYGFLSAAETCYRRAAALDRDDQTWPYYLAVALHEQGDWGEAAARLDDVVRRRPDDPGPRLYRAEANRRLGRLDAALEDYRAAARSPIRPSAGQGRYGAGQVALARGDAETAVDELRAALELMPKYGAARYALGQALRKLGRLDEARRELALAETQRGLGPPPDLYLEQALAGLRRGAIEQLRAGIRLAQAGDLNPAVECLREAVRIDPDLAEAHSQLGAALLELGEPLPARRHLERALELNPALADASYNLGLLEHRHGEYEQAVAFFRAAVEARPQHFDARLGLGTDLARLHEPEPAASELRQAISIRPDDPRPHKRLAALLVESGRDGEAVAVLRRAAGLLPDDLSIADRLAWILAVSADPEVRAPAEALAIADAVCAATGRREPRPLDTRAAALAALGRFPEAVEAGEAARSAAEADGDRRLAAEIGARVLEYRSGRPWHQQAADVSAASLGMPAAGR